MTRKKDRKEVYQISEQEAALKSSHNLVEKDIPGHISNKE